MREDNASQAVSTTLQRIAIFEVKLNHLFRIEPAQLLVLLDSRIILDVLIDWRVAGPHGPSACSRMQEEEASQR